MSILERIPEIACPECKADLEENGFLKCGQCGKVYNLHDGIPYMIDEDMEEFAKEIAVQDSVAIEYVQKRYEDVYAQKYHDWWTDQMLKRVKSSGRILDNGCGTGLLFEKLGSERVVGLDISSEMLKYASRYSDKLVLGNSQKLCFKDDSFDVVFCRSLLHHLPKPELAVKEMSRILRAGGEAVFVDTNCSILSSLPRAIANRGEHFSEDHKNLTRNVIENLLKPYFEVEEVMYFGYLAYPVFGFPDILPLSKYIPFKSLAFDVLLFIDNVLSKIPILRTQSWGILVKAVKYPGKMT